MVSLLDMPVKECTLGGMLAKRAELSGDRTCLVFEDESFTYG